MAKIELTDGIVKTLPVPKKGLAITRDSKVAGFGVRVLAKTGTRSWVLDYSASGRRFLYTLALCSEMKCGPARALATDLRRRIKFDGYNPALEQKQKREAPDVNEIADDYLESIAGKASAYDTKNAIERDVRPALGKDKAAAVTPAQVQKLHAAISARGSLRRANQVVDFLLRIFKHAEIEPNPAKRIKRNAEPSRDRVLAIGELVSVWKAADAISGPHGHAVKLLMLTGQRRGEVSGMLWGEIDFANKEWNLPAHRVKNRVAHSLPLSDAAIEILAALPRTHGERVFPADIEKGFSYWKERLDMAAHIAPWTYHDLRRSAASHLGDCCPSA